MAQTEWLDDSEQITWRTVLEMCCRLVEGIDNDVSQFGITLADYEVLVYLSEAGEEGLRMTQLANQVLVSKSRLTYRVDRLQSRGLVVRKACSTDKRGFCAVLTPEGLTFLQAVAPSHVASVRARLVDLLDRQEFDMFGSLAAKVVANASSPVMQG